MAGLIDFFQKRKVIEQKSSDGLELAIETIESLQGRSFILQGLRMRYKNQPDTEVLRFIQEDLSWNYNYSSSVTRSIDSKGTQYIRIKIEGWAGLRAQFRRPSPFDRKVVIKTRIQNQ
jgi:hypothetical protein